MILTVPVHLANSINFRNMVKLLMFRVVSLFRYHFLFDLALILIEKDVQQPVKRGWTGGRGYGDRGCGIGGRGCGIGGRGVGSGSRGGGKRGNCGRGSGKIGGRNCFFY